MSPRAHWERVLQRTPPSGLEGWKFKTEQHWVIDEIGRDIVELVLYAKDANVPVEGALEFTSKISPGPGEEFSFSAKTAPGAVSEKLLLKHHLWAGENYFPWARAALDKWKIDRPMQTTPPNAGLLKRLAAAQPRVLLTESQRVSKDLSQHPLDAGPGDVEF